MPLKFPVSLYVSNVPLISYTDTVIPMCQVRDNVYRFYNIKDIEIVDNVYLCLEDKKAEVEVSLILLLRGLKNNKNVCGLIISDEDDLEWFKTLKFQTGEITNWKGIGETPLYVREGNKSNLYIQLDNKTEIISHLFDKGKLHIEDSSTKCLINGFLQDRL